MKIILLLGRVGIDKVTFFAIVCEANYSRGHYKTITSFSHKSTHCTHSGYFGET